MKYYFHLAFSLLLVFLYSINFSVNSKIGFVLVALLFSFLPDIDEYRSKIGKKLWFISVPLKLVFGHRKIIHSIFVPLILSIAIFLFSPELAIAAFIGYMSHLLLDALTPAGIMFFYPLFKFKISGFVKTDSFLAEVLFFVVLVLDVVIVVKGWV